MCNKRKVLTAAAPREKILRRMGLVEDDSFILDLEPLHGILLGHPLMDPDTSLAPAATGHTVASTLKYDIEVHPINTC